MHVHIYILSYINVYADNRSREAGHRHHKSRTLSYEYE